MVEGCRLIPSLRTYQQDIIKQIIQAKNKDKFTAPMVASPTGSGKTVMFAYIAAQAQKKGKRALILVHRIEILQQTIKTLHSFGVQAGAIASGVPMTNDLIQVAMVSTLVHRLDSIITPDLIIIDEAHHSVAGTWLKIIKAFPNVLRIGFSATPERADGTGLIVAGYDTMIEGPTTRWLVDNGYLARPRIFLGPNVKKERKKKYKTKRGDYDKDEQFQEKKERVYIGNVIEHYRQHLPGMPTVCFCVSVEHCRLMEKEFNDAGYKATTVHGGMKRNEREAAIGGLATGEVQVVCSCDVISEGVDVPVLAGVILLRRTKSLGLYLQQVGRALRPIYADWMPLDTVEQRKAAQAAGIKPYAIVLDHAGNFHEHGSVLLERNWSLHSIKRSERKDIKRPEVTICPACGGCFEGIKATCPDCGYDIDTHRLHEQGKRTPKEIEGVLREVLEEGQTELEITALIDQADRIQHMDPGERQRAMLANLRRHGKSDRVKGLATAVGYQDGWAEKMYHKIVKVR